MLDQDLFRFTSIFLYPNINKENENHLLLPISRDKHGSIKFDKKRTTSKLKKIHEFNFTRCRSKIYKLFI